MQAKFFGHFERTVLALLIIFCNFKPVLVCFKFAIISQFVNLWRDGVILLKVVVSKFEVYQWQVYYDNAWTFQAIAREP